MVQEVILAAQQVKIPVDLAMVHLQGLQEGALNREIWCSLEVDEVVSGSWEAL